MSERLSVAVRVRPFLPHESLASCVTVQENQIAIGESRTFAFDRVFDMAATSDDVYVALGQPLADSFLSGYHASTIAYGQTGAGKTFTMAALLNDTVQEIFCRLTEETAEANANSDVGNVNNSAGVSSSSNPAGATAGLGTSSSSSPTTPAYTLSLTVLEVYNEAVGDLLSRHVGQPNATTVGSGSNYRGAFTQEKKSSPGQQPQRPSLQLREDPSGGVYVVGLTEITVDSEASLLALIDDAIGNRKTASTLMNATSSRSHCVITLTLQRRGLCSRCCFVDLAGSERLKKSLGFGAPMDRYGGGSNGGNYVHNISANATNGIGSPPEIGLAPANAAVRMREGININSGLLALGNVIVALCEKRPHVPYRASKLTRLLQPMLEGHSRTAMIACVAPLASSLEETLNTLKYADRAKRIHVNPHLAVASTNNAADAQQLINLLREQLEEAKQRLAAMVAHNRHLPPSFASEKPRGIHTGDSNSSTDPALPTQVTVASTAAAAASPADDVERLRQLLVQEQEITKRLENDLFNAEYTAMVEVEKRKALEARVAQLEAYIESRGDRNYEQNSNDLGSSAEWDGVDVMDERDGSVTNASPSNTFVTTTAPNPRGRLTSSMARLQQLEEERNSLAEMRAKRVRDTQRLEAALAADGGGASLEDEGDEGNELSTEAATSNGEAIACGLTAASGSSTSSDAAAAATSHMVHLTVDQLTEEIQQREVQIALLQRENDEVSAQLAHFEHELHDTLAEKARLQEELRRAEVQLGKSAMEREQKELEKVSLRASYLERIRRAEVKATESRLRVREAEQAVRARQESIDKTRHLQEKVMQLREEVTRQRLEVRSTKKQIDQRSAAHQHEVLQLQRQLQLTTAQVAQLHQRMERKDAAIAKVKKQLAEQQQSQQVQSHASMPLAQQSSTPPPPLPPPPQQQQPAAGPAVPAPLQVSLHKIPANKQTSSRSISLKQPPFSTASPPTVSLSDTPPSGTSPVRITKQRVTSSSTSLHHTPPPLKHHQRRQQQRDNEEDVAAQAQIDCELKDLERMEKELAELREYREVLLSAQITDAPKWHRAKEGFTRRLATIQSELQTVEAGTPAHTNLMREEADVAEKLRQLQGYRHMFEDADEQLAEFENRIDNLNDARKFHLQRIRRLQQAAATRAASLQRRSSGGTSSRNGSSTSSFNIHTDHHNSTDDNIVRLSTTEGGPVGPHSLPSVRDIRETRLAYSVMSLTHKSALSDTPPPPSPPPRQLEELKVSGNSAAYTAALEAQVARLQAETRALQARLKPL